MSKLNVMISGGFSLASRRTPTRTGVHGGDRQDLAPLRRSQAVDTLFGVRPNHRRNRAVAHGAGWRSLQALAMALTVGWPPGHPSPKCDVTVTLTIVTDTVTYRFNDSRSVKGPAAEANRGSGARAVPAGGIAGRSRAALGISRRQAWPAVRCALDWDR